MDGIELTDYALAPHGAGYGLAPFRFVLEKGQICAVHGDESNDICLFLRALATLERPVAGTYHFLGHRLDFSDYRSLLPWRRKISYIGRDSTMISNLTLRENLLLEKAYFDDRLNPDLPEDVAWFCDVFNMTDELETRPAAFNPLNLRVAVAIRELIKDPQVLIVDSPENIFSHPKHHYFIERIHSMTAGGLPFVYFTEDPGFLGTFAGREVRIHRGELRETSPPADQEKEMDHSHGDGFQ